MTILQPKRMGGSPYASEDTGVEEIFGWTSDANNWSYVGEDSPTFIIQVDADATTTLSPGMRWRGYQGGVLRQGIITAVASFSGGYTRVTLYTGTDYLISNSAITDVAYSAFKAPYGFSLDPAKWTVEKIYSSTYQSPLNPVVSTWYNVTSIDIPIGIWNGYYEAPLMISITGTGTGDISSTLSTGSSTESDKNFTFVFWAYGAGGAEVTGRREVYLSLTSKITYYFNIKNTLSNPRINVPASIDHPLVIRLVCAYL